MPANEAGFPVSRPRRLRATAPLRRLVSEHRLYPAQLVLPLFVREGLLEPAPIPSMPGVVQHTLASARAAAREAVVAGVGGIMVFGIPETKDAYGTGVDDPQGILNRALREIDREVGSHTVLMADLCLDEFTDHGHCGLLNESGEVDNDATLERYASAALAQAAAGAKVLGLSGMMDGQVGHVRRALDAVGRHDVSILAYAVKYASAFYGPFRDAVCSSLVGDRKSYQQDPANLRESMREVRADVGEGADIVMVKPALAYGDVIRAVRQEVEVPVWAYQVSGEYSMVEAAAREGWIDRDQTMLETLLANVRAGADVVLTYWAVQAARLLADQ